MPGRKLIEEAPDAAERTALLCQAYDLARQALESRLGCDGAHKLNVKLAGVLLMLARNESGGVEELRDKALNILLRELE